MKDAKYILVSPLVTEKGTRLRDEQNKYFFKVARDANKIEVKRAVEEMFKVKVIDVNTQVVYGKLKRYGRFTGRRATWKKACVKLSKDSKIELFEGV